MDFDSRSVAYSNLLETQVRLRCERAEAEALSDVAQQLYDREGAAAAALTGSDEEARFVVGALEGPDGAGHRFAIRALIRRQQFPLVYMRPVIRAGIARGLHGSAYVRAASSAWGPTLALSVLTEALDSNELTVDRAEYLAYYVAERRWAKDPTPETERRRAREAFKRSLVEARNTASGKNFGRQG